MTEQMPELSPTEIDRIMTKAGRDKYSHINMGAAWVARAQRELLKGWRKVPSVEELREGLESCRDITPINKSEFIDIGKLHHWLQEER